MPIFGSNRRLRPHTRGFSLIELLVVIAIIMLISLVMLARYRSFNSSILLRNLAYEIALSTREAQVLGVSVRGAPGSITSPFNYAYGMHFSVGTTYTSFVDRTDNGQYDTDASASEALSVYTIGQKNRVSDLCVNNTCGYEAVDVLFKRPEPDARFHTSPSVSSVTSVRIIVGPQDPEETNRRTVRVWPTGQIEVCTSPTCT
jgi:prepilin-type N-terminal cleavage/methylation domain-containing protein